MAMTASDEAVFRAEYRADCAAAALGKADAWREAARVAAADGRHDEARQWEIRAEEHERLADLVMSTAEARSKGVGAEVVRELWFPAERRDVGATQEVASPVLPMADAKHGGR